MERKADVCICHPLKLLSCSVCTVVSQTCPSYTAGFTGDSEIHPSSAGAIYVNDAPAHRAPCDGTVYAWHYCYYPENDHNNEVAFGVYDSANDQFILRDESYYLLDLDSRENSFTCGNITLTPSQQFQIYEGDRVGACMRGSKTNFLHILAERASSDVSVVRWGQNSGNCRENNKQVQRSNGQPASLPSSVLHLYVNIGKLNKSSNCLHA